MVTCGSDIRHVKLRVLLLVVVLVVQYCCRAALPNPPTSVIVTDVSADSISLSWSSGNDEPISSYVVQFRAKYPTTSLSEGEEAEWRETVDVLRTELTVRGLTAFTAYELRVLAVTSIGPSGPSASVDATTNELGLSVSHVFPLYVWLIHSLAVLML